MFVIINVLVQTADFVKENQATRSGYYSSHISHHGIIETVIRLGVPLTSQ